ncbi:MAG: MFS transporter [Myxococcales bacterium]|nr:MFS transporter [Myxococcales bacterium]
MPTPVARVAAKPGCGGKEAILVVRAPDRRDGVPSNLILVLMMSVTILNVMDRQLLAVLIEPIGLELGASDTAMGLLTGTSFALLHVVASFPVAIWADRGDRRTIIALGLALWSGLTVATGFARSYVEMFLIRIGVGIGETTGGPPAQAFLADAFPPDRRSTAIAVLVMGGPLGSMLAFALGGWLGETVGWRGAFVVFGLPGLLLAVVLRLVLREPRRGAYDAADREVDAAPVAMAAEREADAAPVAMAAEREADAAPVAMAAGRRIAGTEMDASAGEPPPLPPAKALRMLLRTPALAPLMVGAWANTVGIYAVLVWAVPYLGRVHGLSTGAAGARLAIASGLASALGTWAGGVLADRLGRRDRVWLARLPALACAAVLPLGLAFAFASDGDLASVLLAPASFLSAAYFGPVFGAVQTFSPPRARALAATCITAGNTILGLGLAPPLVGWLNERLAPAFGDEAIRYSLALMMTSHAVAALLFLRAQATLRAGRGAISRSESGAEGA